MRYSRLSIVVLSLGVMPVAAQDNSKSAADLKAMAQWQQKMLKQFDQNKDGVLSDQEKLAAQEALRKNGWPAFGLPAGGLPSADQFLKPFDKDGDGKLNDAERAAAQAAFNGLRGNRGSGGGAPQFGPPAPPAGPQPPAETPAAEKPTKVSALVKRFDKDGDGKLSDEEKAAAQAELKNRKPKPKSEPKDKPKADK